LIFFIYLKFKKCLGFCQTAAFEVFWGMLERFRFHRRWALAFACLIALASVPRAKKLQSPDFKVFYVAARHALTDAENVYRLSPDRYLYPPSTALLLAPFAFTENFSFHQWVWHGLLAFFVYLLASSSWAALTAIALLSRYLAISFGYGQINLVVMGLLAGAGAWLARRPSLAGGLWAVAVSLKVYPLVFAPAFLPKENRRGILGAALVGVGILLLPFLVWGPALAAQLYGEFFLALQSKGMPVDSHNQSFHALLLRLFTDQPFKLQGVEHVQWTILSLPPSLVSGFALALGGILSAITWLKASRKPESYLAAATFCILFLSHIVWKDYLLFLFFPLAEIFRASSLRKSCLVAGGFLALVTLSSPDILGPPTASRLDAACIHLWAAVLVWWAWLKK
jgi:hypothetical protein